MSVGEIIQVIGPVVDVKFTDGDTPNVYDALVVKEKNLILEVEQLIGDNVARTIAMGVTDGLSRGLAVENTKQPISVPVGTETLGRILNVVGEPIDNKPALNTKKCLFIVNHLVFLI